ncbi:putative protein kinase [Trypanosoma grayi]|uniref:putative protein kinase n=1 Tax=Trypanosoma grayi TaxID=71804 RepID=UPI0004F43AD4|nr:putative protein kinase [Trypanosoma grayi]KEG13822.1 putative protein kinase [Trypanosoma grayi]
METNSDVTEIKYELLLVHIERCERLLRHPTLLSRLPDGGEGIRQRHALYVAELSRRCAKDEATTTMREVDKAEVSAQYEEEQSYRTSASAVVEQQVTENTRVKCSAPSSNDAGKEPNQANVAESDEKVACAVSEKYKHCRVPVEEIVRRTFGGSLCEAEIQRILNDVPPNFFLTHEETLLMQQKRVEEERLETLERLRRQQQIRQ